MKRRSFAAGFWLLLAGLSGIGSVLAFSIGDHIQGSAQAVFGVCCGVVARFYYLHPERMNLNTPNEPVPREWRDLAGILIGAVVVSALVLSVTNG